MLTSSGKWVVARSGGEHGPENQVQLILKNKPNLSLNELKVVSTEDKAQDWESQTGDFPTPHPQFHFE